MQMTIKKTDKFDRKVVLYVGYDEKLDYVFMCIYHDDELIFDNLKLENALDITDFTFFSKIAKNDYGIELEMIKQKINDYRASHLKFYKDSK